MSDYPGAFNYLTGSLGLSSTQYRSIDFSDPNWETTQYSLVSQARRVNRDLNLNIYAPQAKNLILVGHSQGGLRTRQFLQQEIARVAPRPGQQKHLFLKETIPRVFGGSSLAEMQPGSPFLNKLNNVPGCTTRTSTSSQSVLWVVKQIATSSTSCGSGGNAGFGRIPSNTYVMNIVGQNSSLESASRAFTDGSSPLEIGAVTTILAAAFWAAAFPSFGATIPIAVALTGLAILMLSLQLLWNGMVGSSRHDLLISEDSQELRNAGDIGGRFLATRKLPQAFHADLTNNRFSSARDDRFELRSLVTRTALADLRAAVEGQ